MAYIKDETTGKWQNVETFLPTRERRRRASWLWGLQRRPSRMRLLQLILVNLLVLFQPWVVLSLLTLALLQTDPVAALTIFAVAAIILVCVAGTSSWFAATATRLWEIACLRMDFRSALVMTMLSVCFGVDSVITCVYLVFVLIVAVAGPYLFDYYYTRQQASEEDRQKNLLGLVRFAPPELDTGECCWDLAHEKQVEQASRRRVAWQRSSSGEGTGSTWAWRAFRSSRAPVSSTLPAGTRPSGRPSRTAGPPASQRWNPNLSPLSAATSVPERAVPSESSRDQSAQ